MDNESEGQEQRGGIGTTDRRTLLRTAGIAGAAGAALAGTMHGKFALAPITEAQAQTTAAMPKGPLPGTAKMRGVQRTVRRR